MLKRLSSVNVGIGFGLGSSSMFVMVICYELTVIVID